MENVYIIMEESTPFGDVVNHRVTSVFLSKEKAKDELARLQKKLERVSWVRYYIEKKEIADA